MKKALFTALGGLFLIGLSAVTFSSTKNPHGEKLRWVCEDCHTAKSWTKLAQPMKFAHAKTGFVLNGAHAAAACIGCHKEPIFNRVGTACADCHTDVHKGQLGFSCQNCHTSENWKNQQDILNLHAQKGFALTGMHAVTDCQACHKSDQRNEYARVSTDCFSCHQASFASAKNPDHVQGGFSRDCAQCHTAGTWTPAVFDHRLTRFQLTGAHQSTPCASCHASGYAGTPVDCYSCHQTSFAVAKNPDHVQSGFSHECASCHTTTAWMPARFDHALTRFPLTGAHISVACIACHASGYAGTSLACIGCHQTDYAATSNPSHMAAGFPTVCQSCHNTTAWVPSSWNHDAQFFRINSGTHRGKWTTCADCHVNRANYAVFECINCHAHSKTLMDPKHSGVRNYQFASTACYSCHNR